MLSRRLETLGAKLGHLGDLTSDDTGIRGGMREVRFLAVAPGLGLATEATFEYREIHRRRRGKWEIVRYSYEYRDAAGGRRAYHFHDGRFHAHCLDPRAPRAEHHRRAVEVDLFEAEEEFRRLYLSGEPVSCHDLRPALRPAT